MLEPFVHPVLREILHDIDRLEPFPEVASKVLELTLQEGLSDAEMIPAVVETVEPTAEAVQEAAVATEPSVEEIAQVVETATPEPTQQQLAAKPVGEGGESRQAWTPTPTHRARRPSPGC